MAQVRISLTAALVYLIMPFDLFPDFVPLVGFSDDFIGLRVRDEHTEAIKFCVENEDRLNLCLWNIPEGIKSYE